MPADELLCDDRWVSEIESDLAVALSHRLPTWNLTIRRAQPHCDAAGWSARLRPSNRGLTSLLEYALTAVTCETRSSWRIGHMQAICTFLRFWLSRKT